MTTEADHGTSSRVEWNVEPRAFPCRICVGVSCPDAKSLRGVATMSADSVCILLLIMQKVADNASALPPDVIDIEVFEQLLEMDEEDDRDFSKSLVYNYFEQAESTFENMRKALYVLLLMQCIGGARGTFDVGSLS